VLKGRELGWKKRKKQNLK